MLHFSIDLVDDCGLGLGSSAQTDAIDRILALAHELAVRYREFSRDSPLCIGAINPDSPYGFLRFDETSKKCERSYRR